MKSTTKVFAFLIKDAKTQEFLIVFDQTTQLKAQNLKKPLKDVCILKAGRCSRDLLSFTFQKASIHVQTQDLVAELFDSDFITFSPQKSQYTMKKSRFQELTAEKILVKTEAPLQSQGKRVTRSTVQQEIQAKSSKKTKQAVQRKTYVEKSLSPSSSGENYTESCSASKPKKKAKTEGKGKSENKTKTPKKSEKKGRQGVPQVKELSEKEKKNIECEVATLRKGWEKSLKNPEISDICCVGCTNQEILRAVKTRNLGLLKKIMTSKKKVSTFLCFQGPEMNQTALELLIEQGNVKMLKEFFHQFQAFEKSSKFAEKTPLGLQEITTGYNSRKAYGVQTRQVQLSRGNQEGNNALVANLEESSNLEELIDSNFLSHLYEKPISVEVLRFLHAQKTFFPHTTLINAVHHAVRAGNREVSGFLIKLAFDLDGFGFNKLHYEVIQQDNVAKLTEFRKVSVLKKNYGFFQRGIQGQFTPIHCACINPNPEFLIKLLEMQPELNLADDQLRKPVHYAAACSGPGPLRHLIDQGIDTREGDKRKITPLMISSQYGRAQNVALLLQQKNQSNVRAKTRESFNALDLAAFHGHLECVKLLIEEGGLEPDFTGYYKMTPLAAASARNHLHVVEYLLQKKANIHQGDKLLRTPLILAVKNGNLEICEVLLKNGANPNDKDSSNNYVIHYATAYGHWNIIQLLLAYGADLNSQNNWNLACLSLALGKNHTGIVKKLLSFPQTDVNCKDKNGRSVLSQCIANLNSKSLEQFKFLIEEKGANVDSSDIDKNTVLHRICCLQQSSLKSQLSPQEKGAQFDSMVKEAIAILIRNRVQLNSLNSASESAFLKAIRNANFPALEALLDNSTQLEFKPSSKLNRTVLHDAKDIIAKGELRGIKILERLILLPAKNQSFDHLLNSPDNLGLTVVHYYVLTFVNSIKAIKKDYSQVVLWELLEEGKIDSYQNKPMDKQKYLLKTVYEQQQVFNDFTQKNADLLQKRIEEKLEEYQKEFCSFLLFLKQNGADFTKKVGQIELPELRTKLIQEFHSKFSHDPQKQFLQPLYSNFGLQTVFHLVMKNPNSKLLVFLIENILPKEFSLLDEQDFQGKTPFYLFFENLEHEQAESQTNQNLHLETFMYLAKDLQLNPSIKNSNGLSPMFLAVTKGYHTYTDFLLANNSKAEINSTNKDNEAPLLWSVKNNVKTKYIQQYLKHGGNPNLSDNYGRTSLHYAVMNSNKGSDASFENEQLLIDWGAEINIVDKQGRVPMHFAFIEPQYLVSFNQRGQNSSTQKTISSIDPFETVSNFCLLKDCQLNVKDIQGRTPLHYAAIRGSTFSSVYMVNSGASLSEQDLDQNTPLALAFAFGRDQFVSIFVQQIAALNSLFVHIPPPKTKQSDPNQSHTTRTYFRYSARCLNLSKENFSCTQYLDQATDSAYFNLNIFENLINPQPPLQSSTQLENDIFLTNSQKNFQEGSISFFKSAIAFGWQGISYLILKETQYSKVLAVEDALASTKFKLALTLVKKFKAQLGGEPHTGKQTPLHILAKSCSSSEDYETITQLVAILSGIFGIKAVDEEGKTALHHAAVIPNISLMNLLVEKGLSLNEYDSQQQTPFSISLSQYPTIESLKNHLKNGVDLQKQFLFSNLQVTPLVRVFMSLDFAPEVIDFLLQNGSQITETNSEGNNLVIFAIKTNNINKLHYVLSKSPESLHKPSFEGKNAWHFLIRPNDLGSYLNKEIATELVNHKLCLNTADKFGHSPLDYCLSDGYFEFAEFLTGLGAKSLKPITKTKTQRENIQEETGDLSETVESLVDTYRERLQKSDLTLNAEQQSKIDQIDSQVNNGQGLNFLRLLKDEQGLEYNAILTKVDINFGGYSKFVFYRMQLLLDLNSNTVILFTRWGRIGEIGQYQHTPFADKDLGVKEFQKIFKSKTGNDWANRANFVQNHKKYRLLKFNTNKRLPKVELPSQQELDARTPSKIDPKIQEAIKIFSDRKIYSNNLARFAIHKDAYSLQFLNKEQLQQAQDILTKLKELNKKVNKIREKYTKNSDYDNLMDLSADISELTNKFYEIIPVNGDSADLIQPITEHQIKFEQCLLDSLFNMQTAMKIIIASYEQRDLNPFDFIYKCMDTQLVPLDQQSKQFTMISSYIRGSMFAVHPNWFDPKMQFIQQVFKVKDKSQKNMYKNFCRGLKKNNKMLLFHGTKAANLINILKFGLRPMGIDAMRCGSTLGEGIYFADQFRKSWDYVFDHNNLEEETTVFLLVCEVDLGQPQVLRTYEEVEKRTELDNEHNSVHLQGSTFPQPEQTIFLKNQVQIPLGKVTSIQQLNGSALTSFDNQLRLATSERKQEENSEEIEDEDGSQKDDNSDQYDQESQENKNIPEEEISNGDEEKENGNEKDNLSEVVDQQPEQIHYHSNFSEFVISNKDQMRIRYLIQCKSSIE